MIGQILNDRYEILEKIGEGGMAIAYRGRDRVLGRVVAIKVMRPELGGDAEFLARFRREARAAAGVSHENIASVYDTGNDGAHHYIVMEYVEGESVKERLRREGPLPVEEALRIATATAKALEAAHSVGVVHRDIKPHNILLGREGQVKVTDFGIARAMSQPRETETSKILGSVSYVSPEQARGDAVSPQSDIYSLGVTLFEMLTGKPPFNGGDRVAILHKHVYDRPPRASDLRPGLPHEVDSVIAHSLEKELSNRFASAREMRSYLAACPRGEPEEDTTGLGRRLWRRRVALGLRGVGRRMTRPATAAGLGLLLVTGVVAGVTWWPAAGGRLGRGGEVATVRVPDIVGMSAQAAQEYVESRGLGYRETHHRPSDTVAPGSVSSQDPPAGSEVAAESVIKVVLSDGSSHVMVPEVTQMSVAQARHNLEAAGLASGVVREDYHDTVPADYVASTLPAAGASVASGTAVDLVVSLGPPPSMPPGPPLPSRPSPSGEREEVLNYVVPSDPELGEEVEVKVEVVDEQGRRTVIYEGTHRPGESLPPQTIVVSGPKTARILVNGRLRSERQYLP